MAPNTNADSIVDLKRKRTAFKTRLTKYKNFLAEDERARDPDFVQVKVENLTMNFERFIKTHEALMTLEPDLEQEHEDEFEQLENEYLLLVTESRRRIKPSKAASVYTNCVETPRGVNEAGNEDDRSSVASSVAGLPLEQHAAFSPRIKLPEITLPKFDGSIEKWQAFREKFESRIGRNDRIPDIDKLQYLQASLTGKAARAIEAIESTGQNYVEVWRILTAKYDNSRKAIMRHLDILFNTPRLTRDTPEKLDELLDTFRQHLRALKGLGQPIEHWDSIIIYFLTKKIGDNTRFQWETTLPDNKMPSSKSLLDFIEKRGSCSEDFDSRTKDGDSRKQRDSRQATRTREQSHGITLTTSVNKEQGKSRTPCGICKGSHSIYKCRSFKGMTVSDRKQAVSRASLCSNCLMPGHFSDNCLSGTCRVCNEKHSTFLHTSTEEISSATQVPATRTLAQSQVPAALTAQREPLA